MKFDPGIFNALKLGNVWRGPLRYIAAMAAVLEEQIICGLLVFFHTFLRCLLYSTYNNKRSVKIHI